MFVGRLDRLDTADLKKVGGKASNLGKLMACGENVPEGYVIWLDSGEIDESLLLKYYDDMNCERAAVRSSAIYEDGEKAAWAGQLETLLNVSRSGLVDAVSTCRNSIFTDRAKSYAKSHGVKAELRHVAVVVQKMIDCDVSGVAFSKNPISGNKLELMIEAGYGLGEAIVSGIITPDNYILDSETGNILNSSIFTQDEMLVSGEFGSEWIKVSEHDKSKPKVSKQMLEELCFSVRRIKDYFGFEVDVEWGFCDGELYIMQCRPITT